MWYRGYLALLLVTALGSVSCNEDDIIAAAAGDPVPTGMGVMTSTAAAGAVNAVALVLNDAALASTKPSPQAASPSVVLGVFPELSSIQCGTGSMTISGDTSTLPANLGVTFSACQDGPYTVNGGATITIPSVRTCTEDTDEPPDFNHDVPNSLTGTVTNGTTVTVDGQVLTLTNIGIAITNPRYDGYPDPPYQSDPTGDGGTCGIVSADVVATGQVSTEFQGETTTIDFGSSSLNVSFVGSATQVEATIAGDITIDTICTDGAFPLTISTVPTDPLVFPDNGDGTPTSGTLIVNGETVNFLTNPSAIPCSGFL
ncbi:MAG: hypothetical protein AB1451_14585 [Nitrospirota bacterium]